MAEGIEAASAPLQVLLVDDEDLARARLRRLVEACPDPAAQVAAEAADGATAAALLAQRRFDCVLLDIHMPGTDGLALARQWREAGSAPAVIFVTAYSEHALDAFDVEALDYLTKPVRAERLSMALRKVRSRQPAPSQSSERRAPAPAAQALLVHERGRVERVPIHEVLYVKAELKYLTLRTAQRSYIAEGSLSELEQHHGDYFLRVHRNALVARHALRALERAPDAEWDELWWVRLDGLEERLQVSRRQLGGVREALEAVAKVQKQ
jgi:two-component system response regulator AlgR